LRKYDFNLDSLYVTNFLNYYRKNEIAQLTKGITIHHLYGKDLSGIELEFPNQSIQMSISNASRDFDLEISWLQKKLQKLIFEKQGMMQALLTGKIRLV
jgi:type I restriction enzyme S subunit